MDLPFLPFDTEEERKQFARCVLDPAFPVTDGDAAIKWCDYVEGKNIFPKLPVHLRTNRKAFEKNERVRHIKQKLRGANAKISALNDALTSAATEPAQRPEISIPKSMPDLRSQARHSEQCVIVGRMAVGHNSNNISNNLTPCNQNKPRGRDKRTRALRRCQLCLKEDGGMFLKCSGRAPRGECAFFRKDGTPIFCEQYIMFGGSNFDKCTAWKNRERDC